MKYKYIDIHSHLNFKAFDEDRDEVIKRADDSQVLVINVGTQRDTSKKAVEMTLEYPEGVYAIVGLHPIHTDVSYHDKDELGEGGQEFSSRGETFDKNIYREFLKNPKVVGIGECGLDYYRCTEASIEKQKQIFLEQIELANEFKKPIMLHIRNSPENKSRNAYLDALEILKNNLDNGQEKGDVHFFAGDWEIAQKYLDFGFCLSFTGVITFAKEYEEIILRMPLDRIMSETDSPYVAPKPFRGSRNEPIYVKEVVKKIAEIKNLNEDTVARSIMENAIRVFGI